MSRHAEAIREAFAKGYRVTEDGRALSPSGTERKTRSRYRRRGLAYAQFNVRMGDGENMAIAVHKLAAYQLFGEPALEKSVHVRHLDGNPTNNALNNLALGTQSDNMLDRDPEERRAHALKAASARRKLTPQQARDIVARHRAGIKQTAIAKEFGVRNSTVSEIVRGKLYSDVTGLEFVPRKSLPEAAQ